LCSDWTDRALAGHDRVCSDILDSPCDINPLEALPVFLQLAAHREDQERVLLARRACLYAVGLMFFFLIFATLILRIFGIPLSMVRIVGGIILTRLGFTLFSSRPVGAATDHTTNGQPTDVAFVHLAMPIMVGPIWHGNRLQPLGAGMHEQTLVKDADAINPFVNGLRDDYIDLP
jgi:Na+/H+ antiporter NhaD/arsenite permease-like protein